MSDDTDDPFELPVELLHDSDEAYHTFATFERVDDEWRNTTEIEFRPTESRTVARGVAVTTPAGRLEGSFADQLAIGEGTIPAIAPGDCTLEIDSDE